ncbi:MAG: TauD/TfdA dioxygenase family protein [Phycisphaerales bacterium]
MSDLLLLASTDVAAKTWFYAGFVVMILFFLALDLGVFNRTSHETTLREALTWTGVWVTTALCFGAGVYFIYEHKWTPGDVVIWDNRCVLHARSDFDPGEARKLRRVTVDTDDAI